MAVVPVLVPVVFVIFVGLIQDQGAAIVQHVFLSSNNPTPCYNDTIDLICHYPNVMDRVNGEYKYTAFVASWREDGKLLYPDEDVYSQSARNQTASRLRVRIDPAIFTGDPVSFTCYLPLTSGGEDTSNSTVVDPQETALAPILIGWVVHNASATLRWDHSIKGLCYNNLTFSYNVTWSPVVGRVTQKNVSQRNTTQSGAMNFVIVDLTPGTVYQVEIVGFSTDGPFQVTSDQLQFNLTTEGPVGGPDETGKVSVVVVVVVVVVAVLVYKRKWSCVTCGKQPQHTSGHRISSLMPGPSDCGQPNAVGSVNLAAVNLSSTPDKEVLDKDNINEKSAREQSQPVFLEQKKPAGGPVLEPILDFKEMEMEESHAQPGFTSQTEEGGEKTTSHTM